MALLEAVLRLNAGGSRLPAPLQESLRAPRACPGCVFSSDCLCAQAISRKSEAALNDERGHAVACGRWRDLQADPGRKPEMDKSLLEASPDDATRIPVLESSLSARPTAYPGGSRHLILQAATKIRL